MINVSTLTTALYNALVANAGLTTLGCTRTRGERINYDPGKCPWIGVYPGTIESSPRTAVAKAWDEKVELQVVAQTSSFGSEGTAASDLLESLVAAVADAVNDTLTLGVTGVRVVKFRREYSYVLFDDDGSGDLFMPQAIIKISLEARS